MASASQLPCNPPKFTLLLLDIWCMYVSMQQDINQVRSLPLHGIDRHMQNNDNIRPGVDSELPVGLCLHGPREFG